MVTHVVIFSWLPDVTEAQICALGQALDALASNCQHVASLRHGRDLAFRQGNGDYALVATFPDKASWDAYQSDPAHKAVVRDFVSPIQASRLTIQF